MDTLRKPIAILLMIVLLLSIPALACNMPPGGGANATISPEELATHTAVVEATEVAIEQLEAENKAVMENPDDKIVFTYAGENQSYHTGLRNKTVFYIDHDLGKVLASESAPFEEPAGCHIGKGTDTVSFEGFVVDGVEITGDLTIKTDQTASGGSCPDSKNSTTSYVMTGYLWAEFVDGQWIGTVTGTATLKQTFEDDLGPAVDDTYAIE